MVIPIRAEWVNLKVNIRPVDDSVDMTRLYADWTEMDFVVEIENVGTENSTAAIYELLWDDTPLGKLRL